MSTTDRAMSQAIMASAHRNADMILDVIVNFTAGVASAVASTYALSDDQIYDIVVKSVPKMVQAQGGPELAQVALGAAVARLVRQKLEAGA
jgi:hypothetical protein